MPSLNSAPVHLSTRMSWRRLLRACLPLGLGLALAVALLALGGGAAPRTAYAAGETCFATIDGTTVYSSTDASAVRLALGSASPGGVVKIAGYCAGVFNEDSTNQVALITQTLTLAGGYTTTNWTTAYPITQPTTLDAQGGGRVIKAKVDATLQGFTLTNGSTTGLSGGGIFAEASLTLTEMTIFSNTADSGGGVFVSFDQATRIASTIFLSNTATGDGGGLHSNLYSSLASLTNVTWLYQIGCES